MKTWVTSLYGGQVRVDHNDPFSVVWLEARDGVSRSVLLKLDHEGAFELSKVLRKAAKRAKRNVQGAA